MSIERELERAEVPLFAANELIALSGSRAQRILRQRINQSITEYEVINALEQSVGGLCTHVRDGWNIGIPRYGYQAKKPAGTPTRSKPSGATPRPGLETSRAGRWRQQQQPFIMVEINHHRAVTARAKRNAGRYRIWALHVPSQGNPDSVTVDFADTPTTWLG